MKRIGFAALLVFLFNGCSSLVPSEQEKPLKEYEKGTYVLKNDVVLYDEVPLKKGEKVKLLLVIEDEYVKVYAYNADVDPLKVDRVFLLYMFEDDFPNKVFDKGVFDKKLFELVTPVTDATPAADKKAGKNTK